MDRLGTHIPDRFNRPPSDNGTVELYRRALEVLLCLEGGEQISDVDLNRFYDIAIPGRLSLPKIGERDGTPYSWFVSFPVDGAPSSWESCFVLNDRLKDSVVSGFGLYGLSVDELGLFDDAEERAYRELREVDLLVHYILLKKLKGVVTEEGRLTDKYRDDFIRLYRERMGGYLQRRRPGEHGTYLANLLM